MTNPKMLVLDIETRPMMVYVFGLWKQDIGINQIVENARMISWAAKWHGEPGMMFASEFHDGREKMAKRLHDLVVEADYLVGWNSRQFDIRHIAREFLDAGLGPVPPAGQIDLMKVAKKALYLPSYKLDYVSQYLGIGQKLRHQGFDLWRGCMDGDPKAWRVMKKYNIHDVTITDGVLGKLMPYVQNVNTGLYVGGEMLLCSNPLCQSADLQKRGFYRTPLSVFQRYYCNSCAKWSKAKTSVTTADLRGVAV